MSESYTFHGTIVYVGARHVIKSPKTGREFVKRDIGIADDPSADYPTILVGTLKKTAKRDNTDLVIDTCMNRTCTVHFNPDGRFYADKITGEKKAMSGITVWKVDYDDAFVESGSATPAAPASAAPEFGDDSDEMPF